MYGAMCRTIHVDVLLLTPQQQASVRQKNNFLTIFLKNVIFLLNIPAEFGIMHTAIEMAD